jgi:dephospho-CoA kinase
MLKIGLTGNIGSGKTMISGVFATLGLPVYKADEASRKLLEDPEVKNEILKQFGYGILTNDREINRRSLATIVFTDPLALQVLNSILHPRVILDFRNWAAHQADKPYLIMEAAIIFESGYNAECDFIIHVSCPKEIAIDRVIKRDRTDGNSVLQRMQFQLEDEEKTRLAHFVIRNDGTELVIPQVLSIHQKLLKVCTQRNDDVAPGAANA